MIYFVGINLISFIIFGIDKLEAIKKKNRIPEKILFILSITGGCFGAGVGMIIFHHKIRKSKFAVGIPALMILWLMIWIIGGRT